MDIGARLKMARQAVGYTLRKAAEESGIGESSLSEFENSKREPKFSQLSRLADLYKKNMEFFLSDKPVVQGAMLWCSKPDTEDEQKKTEAEFMQLCEQYHRLEVLMDEVGEAHFPLLAANPQEFRYRDATRLAEEFQRKLFLGDIPSASLKAILEEKLYVKIFYLPCSGSAISTFSEEFGPAMLLNKDAKLWRRNFDLAHELFHLLTWRSFRGPKPADSCPSEYEEKLAGVFASRLLLPTDPVKDRIEALSEKGQISFEALDEIAREFGVSLEALLWRMLYLYNGKPEEIENYVEQAKTFKTRRPTRRSDEPDRLPERYCSLAIRALNEGRLSLMQFAKYMGLSYRKAQGYLTEDKDFKDEKISVSIT